VPIAVPVTEACGTCGGSGGRARLAAHDVHGVQGHRHDLVRLWRVRREASVPACRGARQGLGQELPHLPGRGEVRLERRLMISVPPGTDNGTKIRLKGHGPRGTGGAPAGDLVVAFQVEPDRFFQREGLDVHCTVPINIVQAMLGTKLRVRTLDGKHVVLRIPAGTQAGRKFRVKGRASRRRGAGRPDRRGPGGCAGQALPEQEVIVKSFADAAGLKY